MKSWILGTVIVVVVFCIGGMLFLYNFAGLRQYMRANNLMNNMPPDEKNKAQSEFFGTNQRGAQNGILAGSWMGRIWMWGVSGLQSFTIDEYSVFSFFDGCSDDKMERLNKGERDVITRAVYSDIDEWRGKSKIGDYVVVYVTKVENGGKVGNLREIYDYNFWLFLSNGIDNECAK
jgi:hypothetical protein